MTDGVDELRRTAVDGMYSSDRRDALEQLGERYGEFDPEIRRRVLETFREVARESTYSDERELARDQLVAAAEADPAAAGPAVRTFCHLATAARHSDERAEAIDALGRFVRSGLEEELAEHVRETLVEVASTATRERERHRARERLAELLAAGELAPGPAAAEAGVEELDVATADAGAGGGAAGDSMTAYLAASLSEHLDRAAEASPEDCHDRARELLEFLENNPAADAAHEEVRGDLESLVDQLSVHPGEELDDQRRREVRSLAERVERLYLRDAE